MGLRRSYLAFNAALGSLYENDLLELSDAPDGPDFDDTAFSDAADMVYNAGGFNADQLRTPEARRLIAETLRQLRRAIDSGVPHEVPQVVRHALENNAFIFSGFKAFHSLREVGLSLTTDNGDIKSFDDFHRDVQKINNQYNHNYLSAEYNHAVGSSLMAARWQQIEADGDKYDLQYRTAQDDHVREDHAILHGTTLPPSDPFWSQYLPPNGWNCRCTAVQVPKGKYPLSDPALSMLRGENCTEAAKQQIFRFNPGQELELFPPRHPYFKAPETTKQIIQELADEMEQRLAEYDRLNADPDYKDVEYEPNTGGVKATHVGHSFQSIGGPYELEAQLAGFKKGYSVILGDESGNIHGQPHTEGTWNGVPFEVAAKSGSSSNTILKGIKHAAEKEADIAVIVFHHCEFSLDNFNNALGRYFGLEKLHDGQFRPLKKIICIQNEQIIHEVNM